MAFHNIAKMTTATTGTGAVTLGSAVSSFLTFALAGVVDGEPVSYVIEDGAGREIGHGVYSATGPTMTRNVESSTNGGAALNLSGNATVAIVVTAADLNADATKALGSVSGSVTLDATSYGTITLSVGGALSPTITWPTVGTKFLALVITNGGSATITWPTITWKTSGGTAPTLLASGVDTVILWKSGGVVYGMKAGA